MSASTSAGPAELHRLLTWFSPAFPIGAYTYSHGLEWAVEAGTVRDEPTMRGWIADALEHGAGWSDAVLIACAYRAAEAADERLWDVTDLAAALSPTRERHLEATAQGRAFARAVADTAPCGSIDRLLKHDGDLALPVVLGAAAAGHAIPLAALLNAALHAFTANLVSAGVRLVPLGQTAGLRALQSLAPLCEMVSAEIASETCAERCRTRSSPTSLLAAMISSASTTTSASSAPCASVTLISVASPAVTATFSTVCVP